MTRPVLRLTLVGTSPLLMHSGSLLDPTHPVGLELREYHEKPVKSASDHAHIGDLEFVGALWLDEGRLCVPSRTILAALRQAAEMRGVERRIRSAFIVEEDAPLTWKGPQTVEDLRRQPDFRYRTTVTTDGLRRMCTRPLFKAWSVTIAIAYDEMRIARSDVIDLMILAGDEIGIGAGRPRFGRFRVVPAAV